jgi:tungstate transport system ATP-binding protein
LPEPVLSFEGVEKSYGGRFTLRVPELAVHPGELLCLVGPSGAGKSTLLRLAALLEAPDAGLVRYGGEAVPTRSAAALGFRRTTSTVFQRPAVFRGTVAENIAYGLRVRGERKAAARERARAEAERVGLAHLFDQPAATLSGGEIQRMAIARALATRPRVLFLDEPTANLDPANVALLEGVVRAARAEGCALLFVTHNLAQAERLADSLGVLWEGQLLAAGSRDGLLAEATNPLVQDFLAGRVVY